MGVDDTFEPEFRRQVNKGSYERITDEDRAWLCDVYREDNARFCELVGRDVSHWVETP